MTDSSVLQGLHVGLFLGGEQRFYGLSCWLPENLTGDLEITAPTQAKNSPKYFLSFFLSFFFFLSLVRGV